MLDSRKVWVLGLLWLCVGCSGFPPNKKEAREHFTANREEFERLAEKIRETEYWRVSIYRQTSVKVTPHELGDIKEQFVVEDDAEWRELLDTVRMFMVLQYGDLVRIDAGSFWSRQRNRDGQNGFMHSPSLSEPYLACRKDFADIPCGRCAVPLSDGWYVYYEWYPQRYSEEDWESYLAGELSLDEYSKLESIANRQCHINGYAKMGYDVEKVFNL